MTDWSQLWERYIIIGGKEIPLATYKRQQRLDALSADAKVVLAWLAKRKGSHVTLVQMTKCLMPIELRTSSVVRQLMAELVAGAFAVRTKRPVYYSGRLRQEAWDVRWAWDFRLTKFE